MRPRFRMLLLFFCFVFRFGQAFSLPFEIRLSSLVYSRLAPAAARLYSIARHITLLLHPIQCILQLPNPKSLYNRGF
jgi:hypothetical protein